MYVACRMQELRLECVSHPALPVDVDAGKMVGYLPVFRSLEDLKAECPDDDYVCIRENTMVPRPEGS